jgi:hypothetical protein
VDHALDARGDVDDDERRDLPFLEHPQRFDRQHVAANRHRVVGHHIRRAARQQVAGRRQVPLRPPASSVTQAMPSPLRDISAMTSPIGVDAVTLGTFSPERIRAPTVRSFLPR